MIPSYSNCILVAATTSTRRARNTKGKGKATDAEPPTYPERFTSSWKVGAHVSSAGGIENAIVNAAAIGYVSMQLSI